MVKIYEYYDGFDYNSHLQKLKHDKYALRDTKEFIDFIKNSSDSEILNFLNENAVGGWYDLYIDGEFYHNNGNGKWISQTNYEKWENPQDIANVKFKDSIGDTEANVSATKMFRTLTGKDTDEMKKLWLNSSEFLKLLKSAVNNGKEIIAHWYY